MKRNLIKLLSVPNLVIFFSALFVVYKLYELPEKVNILENRLSIAEKEIIVLKEKMNLNLTMLSEVRADVKQILKDVK